MTKRTISRRRFLACAGLAGFGLAGDAAMVEPYRLEVGRQNYKSPAPMPDRPLQLLHLSDFHASWAVSLDFIKEAIALGLQSQPDLVCITGDFITRKYTGFAAYSRVLEKLSQAAPTYACLGNHDGGSWAGRYGGYPTPALVREMLVASRIEVLQNRTVAVRLKGRDLRLTGIVDLWSETLNLPAAFPPEAAEGTPLRIVLAHNPDAKSLMRHYAWDLMLAGHTHGGQVVLPLVGSPWAPVHDKKFLAGLFPWEDRTIHITRGVGNVHGVRFNCPPEVSLLTIT
jgi:predicted MPP superfamily phosphohydrolase